MSTLQVKCSPEAHDYNIFWWSMPPDPSADERHARMHNDVWKGPPSDKDVPSPVQKGDYGPSIACFLIYAIGTDFTLIGSQLRPIALAIVYRLRELSKLHVFTLLPSHRLPYHVFKPFQGLTNWLRFTSSSQVPSVFIAEQYMWKLGPQSSGAAPEITNLWEWPIIDSIYSSVEWGVVQRRGDVPRKFAVKWRLDPASLYIL